MILSKNKDKYLQKILKTWVTEGLLSEEKSKELANSIEVSKFDWKRLAVYSFWIAAISLAISIFALILDDVILDFLEKLFSLPPIVKSIVLLIAAGGMYFWGFRRKYTKPEKKFSNEFLLFVGAVLSGAAIAFFGLAVDTGSGHFSLLILIGAIVYLIIGALFPSSFIWVIGLLTFGTWFGTETGYISGWGAYFLGMNYPLRFVSLGIILTATSFGISRTKFKEVSTPTFSMGLLYLFIALWILSIFGNYGDMYSWHRASAPELLLWSLIFAAAAIGAIIWGLKTDDSVARKYGITFLFINLYTKYFEYFWNSMHKAIFFALMAVSFWLLGRYAEKAYSAIKNRLIDDEGREKEA